MSEFIEKRTDSDEDEPTSLSQFERDMNRDAFDSDRNRFALSQEYQASSEPVIPEINEPKEPEIKEEDSNFIESNSNMMPAENIQLEEIHADSAEEMTSFPEDIPSGTEPENNIEEFSPSESPDFDFVGGSETVEGQKETPVDYDDPDLSISDLQELPDEDNSSQDLSENFESDRESIDDYQDNGNGYENNLDDMPPEDEKNLDDMTQSEAIDNIRPSIKASPEEAQKNNALFLNRNKIIMVIAGVMVVFILFFSIIMPALKPSGSKKKKAEIAQTKSVVVPQFISDIPQNVPLKEDNNIEEETDEYLPEEDYSYMFPDPVSYPPVYNYDNYNYSSGYSDVEEIDSNEDVQQVAFQDVSLVADETETLLRTQIASKALSVLKEEAERRQKEERAKKWSAFRPAEIDGNTSVQGIGTDDSSLKSLSYNEIISGVSETAFMAGSGLGSGTGSGGTSASDLASLMTLQALQNVELGGEVDTYKRLNNQNEKNQFRNGNGGGGNYKYNDSTALWKGTIIPAVLDTAINTDLPGIVIATVTDNIYSSVDGKYLLIPQGSKVFAEYNSSVSYNQNRVQIAWNTLIRPDGLEVNLGRVDGVDAQGHTGIKGHVSQHPFEYAKAFGLIGLVTILNTKATNQIEKANQGRTNNYFTNTGEALYEEASNLSDKIIDNALDIQPTIKIDAGIKVNLITNVTMSLPPLQAAKPTKRYVRNH